MPVVKKGYATKEEAEIATYGEKPTFIIHARIWCEPSGEWKGWKPFIRLIGPFESKSKAQSRIRTLKREAARDIEASELPSTWQAEFTIKKLFLA